MPEMLNKCVEERRNGKEKWKGGKGKRGRQGMKKDYESWDSYPLNQYS